MITSSDFYTIPDFAHREDPWVSGNFHNFAALSNIGHDAQQLAHLPRFSLHHWPPLTRFAWWQKTCMQSSYWELILENGQWLGCWITDRLCA
jgi:hypothetical protein